MVKSSSSNLVAILVHVDLLNTAEVGSAAALKPCSYPFEGEGTKI
jgi:hypothetical protein